MMLLLGIVNYLFIWYKMRLLYIDYFNWFLNIFLGFLDLVYKIIYGLIDFYFLILKLIEFFSI